MSTQDTYNNLCCISDNLCKVFNTVSHRLAIPHRKSEHHSDSSVGSQLYRVHEQIEAVRALLSEIVSIEDRLNDFEKNPAFAQGGDISRRPSEENLSGIQETLGTWLEQLTDVEISDVWERSIRLMEISVFFAQQSQSVQERLDARTEAKRLASKRPFDAPRPQLEVTR